MKVITHNNRFYLCDSEDNRLKMIPADYIDFAEELIIKDLDRKRLTINERLQLEIMRFKRQLQLSERYVYELIQNRSLRSIRFVKVKFGEDRLEANFDGLHIVCPKLLFTLARISLYPYSELKSQS